MRKNILFLAILAVFMQLSSILSGKALITHDNRSDGFGAQFLSIIGSAVYAEFNNKEYVYTPFKTMQHNYDNDPDFIAKKEWLINFLDNFDINKSNKIFGVYSSYCYFLCPESRKVFSLYRWNANTPDPKFSMADCANSIVLKKIKTIFRANKNINNYFNTENFNIAIHIRRHNLHDDRTAGTDMPNTVYVHIIERLRAQFSVKNPLFHLYSQGDSKDFEMFNAPDVIVHLNESIENTFTSMVLADLLVVGTSTFSYSAGLLSEGIVYYIPFWWQPLPHWISVDTM